MQSSAEKHLAVMLTVCLYNFIIIILVGPYDIKEKRKLYKYKKKYHCPLK